MDFGPHLLLAVLEGAVTAAVLALTAMGLSIVFGVMRVVNVAHGEFFMLGAVIAWWISTMVAGSPALGFALAFLLAPVLVGLIAASTDWLVLKRVNYDPEATIVATIGVLYVLQQIVLMTYGPDARPVEAPFNSRIALPWPVIGENGWELGWPWGFGTTTYKLFVLAAAAVMLLGV